MNKTRDIWTLPVSGEACKIMCIDGARLLGHTENGDPIESNKSSCIR